MVSEATKQEGNPLFVDEGRLREGSEPDDKGEREVANDDTQSGEKITLIFHFSGVFTSIEY